MRKVLLIFNDWWLGPPFALALQWTLSPTSFRSVITDNGSDHGYANHDTEGKRFKFPHPLLWRNEASLLDQRRTMYFPFALFAYTVCCRRTEQYFSVLRTHKSDAVDGSSGRRYVSDQWHNVPLKKSVLILIYVSCLMRFFFQLLMKIYFSFRLYKEMYVMKCCS